MGNEGNIFDQIIINELLTNPDYVDRVLPHLRADYFKEESYRTVFAVIDSYVQEYAAMPTMEAVAVQLTNMGLNDHAMSSVHDILSEVEQTPQNIDWLYNESKQWALDRSMWVAFQKQVAIYKGEDKDHTVEAIPQIVQDALDIGFDDDLGQSYWEAAGEHYDRIHSDTYRIPFQVKVLNDLTGGGVAKKTLNAVMMPIGGGKTTFLIDLAASYVQQGLNVVYFTCEVEEDVIRHRMDVRMLDKPFKMVKDMLRTDFINNIQHLKTKLGNPGNLQIKEFPAGTATTSMMTSYLRRLERVKHFKADVVMVDYLGEMKSARLPIHMISNTNMYYGSIARELRSMAFEFDIPVWTALQSGRDTQGGTKANTSDIADSITIPKILDFMFNVYQTEEDVKAKIANGYINKTRYGDSSLRNFAMGLDNTRQRFYDLENYNANGTMSVEEEAQVAKLQKVSKTTARHMEKTLDKDWVL